jgi:hypothetical protein
MSICVVSCYPFSLSSRVRLLFRLPICPHSTTTPRRTEIIGLLFCRQPLICLFDPLGLTPFVTSLFRRRVDSVRE